MLAAMAQLVRPEDFAGRMVISSDPDEHRRRAEQRDIDVPGLVRPTWQAIVDREYDPWERDRVVIDTAVVGVAEAVDIVRAAAGL